MLLPTKDGIRCDICGSIHKKKFIYYSVDINVVKVNAAVQQSALMPGIESHDVCAICFDSMKAECTKYLGNTSKDAIKCDLCPAYMKGKFDYNRAVFAMVEVDLEQKPDGPLLVTHKHMDFNICEKCKLQINARIDKTRSSIKEKGDWS